MLTSCTYNFNSDRWDCKTADEEFAIEGYNSDYDVYSKSNKEKIDTILIWRQKINNFPKSFGLIFPNLKQLRVIACGLTTISRDNLVGLEELEQLNLSQNLLTSLPSDLFIGMRKLKLILFQDNKIETMSSKLLEPILKNEPTLIDFSGNSKIDAFYSSEGSRGISLKELMNLIDTNCSKPANEDYVTTVESFKDDFTAGFADLWESGEFSDFTIIVGNQKEFRVHKNVLAIQSPVFTAMFKNKMEEQQTGKMTIADFGDEAVEQFLAYLYTGKIKDVTNAMELFALAAKYDVPKLKAASEQNVLQNIEHSNAYDVFAMGHLYSSTVLQRKAFDSIKEMLPDIELDDGLVDDPQRMKILIEADKNRKIKHQEAEDEFKSIYKRRVFNA